MPSIVYRKDSRSGAVYAYESTSYRDPLTKRPRSKQVYLGRVDTSTNTILPKGTNGKRNRTSVAAKITDIESEMKDVKKALEQSKKEIDYLKKKVKIDDDLINALNTVIRDCETQREALPTPVLDSSRKEDNNS